MIITNIRKFGKKTILSKRKLFLSLLKTLFEVIVQERAIKNYLLLS